MDRFLSLLHWRWMLWLPPPAALFFFLFFLFSLMWEVRGGGGGGRRRHMRSSSFFSGIEGGWRCQNPRCKEIRRGVEGETAAFGCLDICFLPPPPLTFCQIGVLAQSIPIFSLGGWGRGGMADGEMLDMCRKQRGKSSKERERGRKKEGIQWESRKWEEAGHVHGQSYTTKNIAVCFDSKSWK